MLNLVKSLSRAQKQAVFLAVDLILVPLALVFTFAVQDPGLVSRVQLSAIWPVVGLLMVLAAALSIILRIPYMRLNAYDMSGVGKTAVFAVLLAIAAGALGGLAQLGLGAGVYVVFGIVFFLFSAASRVAPSTAPSRPTPTGSGRSTPWCD